jgi:N-terminal domain of galactosyltransferase
MVAAPLPAPVPFAFRFPVNLLSLLRSFKVGLGTLLLDRPRLAWPLFFPELARRLGRSWVDFRNRGERLVRSEAGPGVECPWRWSGDLNVARFLPPLGKRLLAAALADWPVRLPEVPATGPEADPRVSFVVGHRGQERLPHLLATLRSLLAQESVKVECLVVEQSRESVLAGRLPAGVRHLHTPPPAPDVAYSRAWAFNVGARAARGRILVFHDNDLLAPCRYAAELSRVLGQGYRVARLQRFIFYLGPADSDSVLAARGTPEGATPDLVRQNCEGGTLAVERETYFALGGHDETFIGWGGEDNEMFDRCRAVRCYPYGYLPFVHLHHPPQPRPADPERFRAHLDARLAIPAPVRIAELCRRPFGLEAGPTPHVLTRPSPCAASPVG